MQKFTREELDQNLGFLNDQLKTQGITGEMCIVGGAAMLLAFGSRHSTRDIDALVFLPGSIRAAALKVALAHNLPPDWLNDGAKEFASNEPIQSQTICSFSHLRVMTPPAEYILAMKCISARLGADEHDREDAKFLINHLGIPDEVGVLTIVEKYYPPVTYPGQNAVFYQRYLP